jgi:hypothetical protein
MKIRTKNSDSTNEHALFKEKIKIRHVGFPLFLSLFLRTFEIAQIR